MRAPRIGVLALQGDVREHVAALTAAGAQSTLVRRPADVDNIDAVVVPGGESTTIGKLLVIFELLEPLQKRIRDGMPAFGSCAGMILLADRVFDGTSDQVGIGGIDMTVRRNAFGRQVDSWEEDLAIDGIDGEPLHAVFIRAPWVEDCGDDVSVLARVGPRIVAVRQGPLLATAFHPELTGDRRVHELFVGIVEQSI